MTDTVAVDSFEYASFLRRVSGYLIDFALFLPLYIGTAIWLIIPIVTDFNTLFLDGTATDQDLEAFSGTLAEATIPLFLATVGINLLFNTYYVLCLGWAGRTLGGQLLGMRCRSTDGTPASWGQVTLRQGFSFALNTITNFIPGGTLVTLANPAWMLFDGRRQMVMDKVGRTIVIRTRRGATAEPKAEHTLETGPGL